MAKEGAAMISLVNVNGALPDVLRNPSLKTCFAAGGLVAPRELVQAAENVAKGDRRAADLAGDALWGAAAMGIALATTVLSGSYIAFGLLIVLTPAFIAMCRDATRWRDSADAGRVVLEVGCRLWIASLASSRPAAK
jgi:hypothetical protein